MPGATLSTHTLSALLKSEKPEVDARIRQELTATIEALGRIPEPFRNSITGPSAADEVEAAQNAIRKLQATIEAEVKPFTSR